MSRRTRVFVSGPYSAPSPGVTVRTAMEAGNQLADAGFAPFVPHLSYFLDILQTRLYEHWLDIDLSWVAASDVLLRLPGKSPGADREVACAIDHGITVYTDLTALLSREPARR